MIEHYRMFVAYNAWANRILCAAAGELSPEELDADRGAFFGSLFATLTHLLVTDRIWLRRMTGEGPIHTALDEKPFATLAEFQTARTAEDERLLSWVDTLTDDKLGNTFTYSPITKPGEITHRLGPALAHLFNHQTHHRGQCHAILTSLGKPSLALDLIYFLRVEGKQWL